MKGGQTTRSLAEFVDLYPTVADFCSLKSPHATAGSSLRPILTEPSATIKEAAFTLVTRGPKLHGQSIRTARWRLTLWSDGQAELYDHSHDPEESRNVADQHGPVVQDLTARIKTLPKLTP
jgi:iduronate 2-sulfatase